MPESEIEDILVRNMALYTVVGLVLRFVIYGSPSLELVALYVILALCIGVGGTVLAVARDFKRSQYYPIGIVLVAIGLLPFHYLF